MQLWNLAIALRGRLLLINYETAPRILPKCAGCEREQEVKAAEGFGLFHVMEVDMTQQPTEDLPIETTPLLPECAFDEFRDWYIRELDEKACIADLPPAPQ